MASKRLGTVLPLGGQPWRGVGPFVYANHHVDRYPVGNKHLGPDPALLKGRKVGDDFHDASKSGWNMYMATGPVPGFPAHPHRGFETISIVRQGIIDHADSTGAGARYGPGDVQWVTAGSGVRHSEMFPLLNQDKPNTAELYQLWLNLPKKTKWSPPEFTMQWAEEVPKVTHNDGGKTVVTIVAGEYGGKKALAAPRASWASDPDSDLAIFLFEMEAGANVVLPPPVGADTKRLLYVHGDGAKVRIGADDVATEHGFEPASNTAPLPIHAETPSKILVLQAREIDEPIVIKGPFVMNTQDEIAQAYKDYKANHFGWDERWKSTSPNWGPTETRFANYGDGVRTRPPSA
ncbi:Putative quercetin 2,3-dioxygenase [Vanrija pseudolonga]|uniref:Quercetin 2,3-dioxygenase n=1 Tax=Vanrija pseudolonga TaxID=143232 RepID=A0AAF1BSY2_9TREE|nr:Putative quercetin 2,3-dioxygenase [Vanrija pseudolonga]